MKKTEEIYCVIFNKVVREGKLIADNYTLGMLSAFGVPELITIKDNKITVTFDNKTKHTFHYNNDVEIFIREKEEKTEKTNQ